MSLLNKLNPARGWEPIARLLSPRDIPIQPPLHVAAASSARAASPQSGRYSNGLKEFLWRLDGIGRGQMLDLGPVWQSTLSFFLERGYKIYSEDLLGAWGEFQREEQEKALQCLRDNVAPQDRSSAILADRFLTANLRQAAHSFDAVLLWDLLDYLDRDTAARFVARLVSLVREGGAIFAVFHTQKPEEFCRYRVLDEHHFEMVPSPALAPSQRVYQNREIEDLFGRFRSSKAFVGRDHLREAIFVK